jgi:hypothetical protein
MCHCKTCADRLHVIVVITATAIPYSLASCLVRFPFLHTRIPFTSPRFYALPIVHDTSSKNAKVSSATTSFPWCHTNTSENHGYNTVAEDFCADSHFAPRIRHPLPTKKSRKDRKGQTSSDHICPMVSSRPRGRCVQSLVQIGSEIWICIMYKQTNIQLYILNEVCPSGPKHVVKNPPYINDKNLLDVVDKSFSMSSIL